MAFQEIPCQDSNKQSLKNAEVDSEEGTCQLQEERDNRQAPSFLC
jgi:hypothetical protein